jgi:hypothetical protein
VRQGADLEGFRDLRTEGSGPSALRKLVAGPDLTLIFGSRLASRRAHRSRPQQQHDLAGMPLGKEFALRVGDRGERIGPGDDRPDLAALPSTRAVSAGGSDGRRESVGKTVSVRAAAWLNWPEKGISH